MTQPASATSALPCIDIHVTIRPGGSVARPVTGADCAAAGASPVSRPRVRRCPTKWTRMAPTDDDEDDEDEDEDEDEDDDDEDEDEDEDGEDDEEDEDEEDEDDEDEEDEEDEDDEEEEEE